MKDINYTLLGKILSGEATESERKDFIAWINRSDKNKLLYEKYKHFYEISEIREGRIHHNNNRKKRINTNNRKSLKRYTAVAASFLLLISFSYLFHINQQSDAPVVTSEVEIKSITKSNPKGQKSKIMLPDGSVVWLNSDSKLKYYENFSDSFRVVHLTGEAYFEVSQDSLRPFIVETSYLQASVLGTSFNVSAFENNRQTSVALLEGKLLVTNHQREEILLPGDQVKYDPEMDQLKKSIIAIEKIGLWKDGILTFDRESFTNVIHELERWYGVTIKIEGTPSVKWKFTGYFDNENLKNVLEVLSFGKNLNYELEGKNVKLIVQ